MSSLVPFPFLLVVIIAAVWPVTVRAEEGLEGWVPFPINDEALHCGGFSRREWRVNLQGNRVKINPYPPPANGNRIPYLLVSLSEKGKRVWQGTVMLRRLKMGG